MSESLSGILTAFGGVAAMVAVLTWLARTLLTQLLTRDLESFKAHLGAESARSTEVFKAELARATAEFQVKLTALQTKRVQVIAEIHHALVEAKEDFERTAAVLEATGSVSGKSLRDTRGKWQEVAQLLKKNKLFLPRRISKMIEDITSLLSTPWREYWLAVERGNEFYDEKAASDRILALNTQQTMQAFDDAIGWLEAEFRGLLGVETPAVVADDTGAFSVVHQDPPVA